MDILSVIPLLKLSQWFFHCSYDKLKQAMPWLIDVSPPHPPTPPPDPGNPHSLSSHSVL